MREGFELKRMMQKMKLLVLENQEKFYDVWMFKVNDDIQSLAQAFGERFFLQNAYIQMEEAKHEGAKDLLRKIIYLHMISYLNENMSWYIQNQLITP